MLKTLSGSTRRLAIQVSQELGALPANAPDCAMNDAGDLLIVWEQQSGSVREVRGVLVRRVAGVYRIPQPTDVLPIGSIGTGQLQAESCTAPAARALGDGSFVVAFSRIDAAAGVGHIEIVRIAPDGPTSARLQRAGQGQGYQVRGNVNAIGGLAPALVSWKERAGGRECGIAYGLCTLSNLAGASNFREFSALYQHVSWPSTGAPILGEVVELGTLIPVDDTDTVAIDAPFFQIAACATPDEDLAIAWRSYLKASHPGQSGGDVGRVVLSRWQGPGKGSPYAALGTAQTFQSLAAPSRPHMQPRLAAAAGSWGDETDLVTLAYQEVAGAGDDVVRVWEVDFRTPTPDRQEVLWGGVTDEDVQRPAVLVTAAQRAVVAVESITGGGRKLAITHADGSFEDCRRAMVGQPFAPAVAGVGTLDGKDLVALVYAGDAAGDAEDHQVFAEVFELP